MGIVLLVQVHVCNTSLTYMLPQRPPEKIGKLSKTLCSDRQKRLRPVYSQQLTTLHAQMMVPCSILLKEVFHHGDARLAACLVYSNVVDAAVLDTSIM
jgi:hypothetical protein